MKGRSHRLPSHHESHDDWVDGSWTVDCVCGVNFDDGEEMVNCDECGVWVHTRCSRYVKGDELFACDKCKSKNRHNDSEETEVAQLLVELPTKTIRLESNYATGNGSHACRWSNSMEGRVHVQGIPGGDPTLFSGLSSVFTPELWKCTGYVPKKFNFQYKEFPCWNDKVEGDCRNEEENEITVDKGAGVLFSLSKESVFGAPFTALVGVRGMDEEVSCDRKALSKKWENEDGEIRCSRIGVKKERSLIRPVVIHSGKPKKEDMRTFKDCSARRKARAADNEVDAKKRGPDTSKTVAFTSTSDAKPLEFYEDRGPKPFKDDSEITKNKNVRDPAIEERESDGFVAVGNGIGKPNNSAVDGHSSEDLSSDISRNNFSCGPQMKEEKACPEDPARVESSPKQFNLATSVQEHHDNGKMPVKHDGDGLPNGILDDNVESSGRSDLKLTVDESASATPEDKDNQIDDVSDKSPSSTWPSVKKVESDNAKGVLNRQSSVGDLLDARLSCDKMSENSKMKDASVSGSPSNEPKADRTSEAVSDYRTGKADELIADPCENKQGLGGSGAPIAMRNCPSQSKYDLGFEDPSKPGGTILNTPVLASHWKMVSSVGKSISSAHMSSTSPASDKIKPRESQNFDPNAKQQTTPECNSTLRKDQAASDAVKDEDSGGISKKAVKEHPKSSANSTSKVSNLTKISHMSALKRTNSDSKDSLLHPSSKASSAPKSCETPGSFHNESASQVQNEAPAPGLPIRSEKVNVSLQSKGNHALSMSPHVLTNPPATLSDEELALLLHQELNSSPRVPRVPRLRQAGSLPHLASPTATSMLMKCTSSSGGKDHGLVPRRKNRDASKGVMRCSHEPYDELKRSDKVPTSPDQRKDKGYATDVLSYREDGRSSTAVHSIKKNIPPSSMSTANSGPSSSTEVNDQHVSSIHNSPRNFSDEETGTTCGPVHRTLPGLINEIMSKGRRMTYEELCNAVLPHWHNLRKHNGERYAYSSHSQAVLDCLRNRHEWSWLVDRGPKQTSSSRKRRKFDTDESEDNDYGKETTAKEGDRKSIECQREDFPKGKRKARKRRRLALQGRGIKDVRKRRKADFLSDDDSDPFSNSSEESLFSEDEIQGGGAGAFGSEASANSEEMRSM